MTARTSRRSSPGRRQRQSPERARARRTLCPAGLRWHQELPHRRTRLHRRTHGHARRDHDQLHPRSVRPDHDKRRSKRQPLPVHRARANATGLTYYRARYYSPGQQGFIGEDPIGLRGGDVNLYAVRLRRSRSTESIRWAWRVSSVRMVSWTTLLLTPSRTSWQGGLNAVSGGGASAGFGISCWDSTAHGVGQLVTGVGLSFAGGYGVATSLGRSGFTYAEAMVGGAVAGTTLDAWTTRRGQRDLGIARDGRRRGRRVAPLGRGLTVGSDRAALEWRGERHLGHGGVGGRDDVRRRLARRGLPEGRRLRLTGLLGCFAALLLIGVGVRLVVNRRPAVGWALVVAGVVTTVLVSVLVHPALRQSWRGLCSC